MHKVRPAVADPRLDSPRRRKRRERKKKGKKKTFLPYGYARDTLISRTNIPVTRKNNSSVQIICASSYSPRELSACSKNIIDQQPCFPKYVIINVQEIDEKKCNKGLTMQQQLYVIFVLFVFLSKNSNFFPSVGCWMIFSKIAAL